MIPALLIVFAVFGSAILIFIVMAFVFGYEPRGKGRRNSRKNDYFEIIEENENDFF